jgi:arginyl-tRNA synthetase
MNSITQDLQQYILQALKEVGIENTSSDNIHLEHPSHADFGDFSTNIAMQLFPQLKQLSVNNSTAELSSIRSPRQFAELLISKMKVSEDKNTNTQTLLEKVSVAGPGFINFTLRTSFLLEKVRLILSTQGNIIEKTHLDKKAVVEYSSPNIAKPFTVGHLRSTIIGDAVANLLEETGWQVFRDNHLGDWGTQFGKQIYALKKWGNLEQIQASAEPVKELVQLYVQFHEAAEKDPSIEDEARAWFKKLEEGDQEARDLWKICIDLSWKEFNRIYDQLGVHFTENNGRGYGESFFEDKMGPVLAELREKGLVQKSEGAELIFFPEDKYPPLMVVKKDGATLYATRDLATDKFRLITYGSDVLVINEVGAEQSLYWQQIFCAEQLLGWYVPSQRVHVKHGHYRFEDKKMSTRKGNVIWLSDVLSEAVKRAAQISVAKNEADTTNQSSNSDSDRDQKVGIGALKWNDLKRSSHLDVVFKWDEILTMEGNSGPYLQYVYARAHSLLRKAADKGLTSQVPELQTQEESIQSEERTLLSQLSQFDEVVQRAAVEYSPHQVCTYLFELAQTFNTFYNSVPILKTSNQDSAENASQSTVQMRLALTEATALVIQKGLRLLGIQTVEQM